MSEPVVVYANVASIEVCPFDILLHFGLKKDRKAADFKTGDIECSVYLSPQHAKAVAGLLSKAMEEYERAHGAVGNVGTTTVERKAG